MSEHRVRELTLLLDREEPFKWVLVPTVDLRAWEKELDSVRACRDLGQIRELEAQLKIFYVPGLEDSEDLPEVTPWDWDEVMGDPGAMDWYPMVNSIVFFGARRLDATLVDILEEAGAAERFFFDLYEDPWWLEIHDLDRVADVAESLGYRVVRRVCE